LLFSAIGVVIFDKRLRTLEKDLAPDSEAQKFVNATNSAFDGLHHTTLYWHFHKSKKTKIYKQLTKDLDHVWRYRYDGNCLGKSFNPCVYMHALAVSRSSIPIS
jgi:hypothetical protein